MVLAQLLPPSMEMEEGLHHLRQPAQLVHLAHLAHLALGVVLEAEVLEHSISQALSLQLSVQMVVELQQRL
jgi:hypothetical protein